MSSVDFDKSLSKPLKACRKSSGSDQRPRVRLVTPKYLRNAGLAYVQRYASTEQRLRQVLRRRVQRSFQFHGVEAHKHGDRVHFDSLIEDLIKEFRRLSYISDATYAQSKARSLHRQGHSLRSLTAKLILAGVNEQDISKAINILQEEQATRDQYLDADQQAAWLFARKKRLGPYRLPEDRQERKQRDLAAMARRGFSADLAYAVIEAEDIPEDFQAFF